MPDIPTDSPDPAEPVEAAVNPVELSTEPTAEQSAESTAESIPGSASQAPTTEADPAAADVGELPAPPRPTIADLSPAACAARLAELFPAVFSAGSARPLKLRIQADIQSRAPGIFSRRTLSNFLHRHTTSTAYLKALAGSPSRFDLDGEPAGEVADEHRQAAQAELDRRRVAHSARRAAEREAQRKTERDAQREAQQQAMREFALQADARRDRAGLLRAFESTTLTVTNFCALKGISPDELEARLAQARQEREQPAQVRPPQRPQPGGPGDVQRRPARPEGRPRHQRPRRDREDGNAG